MLENLDNYAQKVAPGFDIYWNTTAKFNGSFGALTTNPTNLNEKNLALIFALAQWQNMIRLTIIVL